MKYVDSLETFKSKIKSWKPNNCPCRICKNYTSNVGFLEELGFQNKFLVPFLQDIYSGFGPGVKRPSNLAVAWFLKNFIVFIS